MEERYYFENSVVNEMYPTLWHGYLTFDGNIPLSINYYQKSNKTLDDLLAEICDINFYVSLIDNNIYLSVCRDFNYYYYQFEKNIKIVIIEIEKKFNINIKEGEFFATEVLHIGNKYKYKITNIDGVISLKKKILNWDKEEEKIIKKMNNLKIKK